MPSDSEPNVSVIFFGLSTAASTRDGEEEEEESIHPRERIVFTNRRRIIVRASNLEPAEEGFYGSLQNPASKESIDSMPRVEIGESEEDGECVICLVEWEIGVTLKEMPCKHKFHPNCIDKWLGVHRTCPLCRYQMPIDEGEDEWEKRYGRASRFPIPNYNSD